MKLILLYKLMRIHIITLFFLFTILLTAILGINILLQTNSAKGLLIGATRRYIKNLYFKNITFIPWRLNVYDLSIPYNERKYGWLLRAKNTHLFLSTFPIEIKKIILISPQINIVTTDNSFPLKKLIQKDHSDHSSLPKEFIFKNCQLILTNETETRKFDNLSIEAHFDNSNCDYKITLSGGNLDLNGSLNIKDWTVKLNGTAFKNKISISTSLIPQEKFETAGEHKQK